MVDGLQLSQSLTIQFPQQKQNQQTERQTNEQRKQTKKKTATNLNRKSGHVVGKISSQV